MTKWRQTVLNAVALLFAAGFLFDLALAVEPQGGRGRRGGGAERGGGGEREFFDALGDAMRESPYREILDLLHHEPIREHLKLEQSDYEKLRDDGRQAMNEIFSLRNQDPTLKREALTKKIVQLLDQNGEAALKLLGEENTKRLEGLYAQLRKSSSASNARIAARIGLKGEELQEFRQFHDDLRDMMRDDIRSQFERMLQNLSLDRTQRMKRMEKLWENGMAETERKLATKLSAEQLSKLEELKGPEFKELPTMRLGGRRGPGGPGSPGGRGPGGPGRSGARGPDGERSPPDENSPSTGNDDCCTDDKAL